MRRPRKLTEREGEREEDSRDRRAITEPCRRRGVFVSLLALPLPAVVSFRCYTSSSGSKRDVVTMCLAGYARTPCSHSLRPNQRLRRLETGRPYKCAALQAVEGPRVERGIRIGPLRTARGHYRLENTRCHYVGTRRNINIARSALCPLRVSQTECHLSPMKSRLFLFFFFVKSVSCLN